MQRRQVLDLPHDMSYKVYQMLYAWILYSTAAVICYILALIWFCIVKNTCGYFNHAHFKVILVTSVGHNVTQEMLLGLAN